MKKVIGFLIGLTLVFALGCKSLDGDVIPKTSLDSKVTAPARVLTHASTVKAVIAMVESGQITDEKSLRAAIKELRKIKIPGSRRDVETYIAYASPKNTAADTINVTYNPTNAVFQLYMTNLVTTTDPEVIITSGDAQAKITAAEGEAAAGLGRVGVDMLKELNKATPAGQVKEVIPTPDT